MNDTLSAMLDTHAAVLLWEGRIETFGTASREILETAQLSVSPVVRLELQFLREIGRLQVEPDALLGGLELDLGVAPARDPLAEVIAASMRLSWTRDPFDRLLVGHALLRSARFVTRDRLIQQHFAGAVW